MTVMDFGTNTTENLPEELKLNEDNTLLELVKDICGDTESKLSAITKGKVSRIIADCELKHNASLQRVSTADENTSTVLGFMHGVASELSYDEQADLNQEFIDKIEKKIPKCNTELEQLQFTADSFQEMREAHEKELKERDSKLDQLQEQESEKMDLLMEWLNFRIQGMSQFGNNSTELLVLRSKILNLKSRILHLQILQNIFTETNQSLKAYSEIHKDLKDNITETEKRIQGYQELIENDLNN